MGAEGCQNSNVPPPFLTKTYEMVDDPASDEIVSWSDTNNSFVVWNVADFTRDLLPQYFKHNNFSSFVRQLNTYGFHKIDPERQEFANEGFSRGNKEALKHIHRRKPSAAHAHSQKELLLNGCNDPSHADLGEEVKRLQQEKGLLASELMNVRKLHASMETELETLGQRVQGLEERQQKIMLFMAHAMRHPSLVQFVQQQSEGLALSKKRRLPEQEGRTGVGDSWGDDAGQLVGYHHHHPPAADAGDAVSSGCLEGGSGAESSYERVLKQLAVSTLNPADETSPLSQTSRVALWEMQVPTVEQATHGDSADSSAVLECPEWRACGDLKHPEEWRACGGDLNAWVSSPSNVNPGNTIDHGEEKPVVLQERDGFKGRKVVGSNDVFWESMLTENPRLPDRDGEECQSDGHAHERWFL